MGGVQSGGLSRIAIQRVGSLPELDAIEEPSDVAGDRVRSHDGRRVKCVNVFARHRAFRVPDPDLTPATIAAELKLSARYINQPLEAEGTSLSRYIWSRRLDRCAEQLKDPALRARGVAQIAMDDGFNDLSHFSKAFRTKFGMAPRDYRNGQAMHS